MANEHQIALAEERLQLVEMLNSLRPLYFGHEKIRPTPGGGWTHPWKKFDALRTYLLLTCFDVLGGPSKYLDFQSWLAAGRTSSERNAAIVALPPGATHVDVASTLHKQYLAVHGATQAFYRFLRDVLPPGARSNLLFSVSVREIDIANNLEVRSLDDPAAKEAFLFDVRNKFTHEARDTGSSAGGVFPDWGEPVLIDGVPKLGWESIHHADRGNFRLEYGVRDWPNALISAVRAGIAARRSVGGA